MTVKSCIAIMLLCGSFWSCDQRGLSVNAAENRSPQAIENHDEARIRSLEARFNAEMRAIRSDFNALRQREEALGAELRGLLVEAISSQGDVI